jgi:SPP1 family predicted phage head-tail adaptor
MLQSRIRRGEMDKQITFIKKVLDTNVTNEDEVTSWTQIATNPTVWTKVLQFVGREVVVADQIQSTFQTRFVVDYRTDLDEEMRIVYNSKVYNILSIIEHEGSRNTYLLILADSIPNETFVQT